MNKLLQQKFLVVADPAPKAAQGWVSDKSARDTNMMQPRHPAQGTYQGHGSREQFNYLPPGMNIEDQAFADITEERMAGGLGSGTQVTEDVTRESLRAGYSPKKMLPTDDMATHEHEDPFYFDAEVDGVLGYCERGNVLDRS